MATLHLTLEQVTFEADSFPDFHLEDPISAVVDPNTNFQTDPATTTSNESTPTHSPPCIDFNLKSVKRSAANHTTQPCSQNGDSTATFADEKANLPQVHERFQDKRLRGHDLSSNFKKQSHISLEPAYPGISSEVARYLYKMNPEIVAKMEAALTPQTNVGSEKYNIPGIAKSSLSYLGTASEALALQETVIGSRSIQPASPEEVARVVASVHHKVASGNGAISPNRPAQFIGLSDHSVRSNITVNTSAEGSSEHQPAVKELHRFPAERIMTVTERKKSWFSAEEESRSMTNSGAKVEKGRRQHSNNSRRSSQSSTMSITLDKSPTSPPASDVNNGDVFPVVSLEVPYKTEKMSTTRRSLDAQSVCSEAESNYSERYELDSNYSELLETQSNVSEMSSVSGIEEEMYRIKKLLLEVPSLPDDHPDFHKHSVVLGRTAGIIVSDDCQRMVVDQEVFFELQREKANLEGQLEALRVEIDGFVKEKESLQTNLSAAQAQLRTQLLEKQKETSDRETLESKFKFLQVVSKKTEVTNVQLQANLELKTTDVMQMKEELRDLEETNARLRIDTEELRVELESKDGAVQGLKSKIAELHVEVQLLTQAKIQTLNDQQSLKSEMDALQKSREWYQQQLHIIQESRNKLQQDFLNLQGSLSAQKNEMEKIRTESVQAKQLLQKAAKEKENLLGHLETIQSDMMERELAFAQIQRDTGVAEETLMARINKMQEEKSKLSSVASNTGDLQSQLEKARLEAAERDQALKALEKNYAQTMKHLTIAQKTVNERDMEIQQREEVTTRLEQKVKEMQLGMSSKDEQLNLLQNSKMAIEIALAAANKEKRDVDEALQSVRENLHKLNVNLKKMKTDLAGKAANVEQLQREKNKLEEALLTAQQQSRALKSNYESFNNDLQSRDAQLVAGEERRKLMEDELTICRQHLQKSQNYIVDLTKDKEMTERECSQLRAELSRIGEELVKTRSEKVTTEGQLEKLLASALASSDRVTPTSPMSDDRNYNNQDNVTHDWSNAIHSSSSSDSSGKRNQKVRRNSQDLSDGTKILKNANGDGNPSEAYPRDALERELVLVRQALQTREYQIEKYLEEKTTLAQTVDVLRKENAALLQERVPNGEYSVADNRQLNRQIATQLEVYRRKVQELEHVLQLSGILETPRSMESETQTDNVSFMKQILEQDNHNSSKANQLEVLEMEQRERQRIYDSNIKVLTRKLKEVMKAHKKAEVELKNWRVAIASKQQGPDGHGDYGNGNDASQNLNEYPPQGELSSLQPVNQKPERDVRRQNLHYRAKVKGLQFKLTEMQRKYEDVKTKAESKDELMLALEKEKGKLVGVSQSNLVLKQHTHQLETALAEKEVVFSELDFTARDLTNRQKVEESRNKDRILELEIALTAEQETAKELRRQIFNAKRESSALRKQVVSLQTGLDNANQMVDAKKCEIQAYAEKLGQMKEAETKLLTQMDILNGEHRRTLVEAERLKHLVMDNQTKDSLLAEQMKNLSWHYRQKNQEASALKEQLTVLEQRQRVESDGLKKSLAAVEDDAHRSKNELSEAMKERLNYQTTIVELRTALKSSLEQHKLSENKNINSSILELPIPDSPTPYDETFILNLLEQSALTPQSRPLCNLQSCLNTLKQEMAILQEQLTDQDNY